MSVPALVAELAGNESLLPPDLAALRTKSAGPWSPATIAEDERRLVEFERSRSGVPWDEVKAWMESWGKPHELPAPKPRRV